MQNWKRNFFTIWTGQAFSQLSSSVLQFAFVWHLTDRTGSPLVLSMAMLVGFLPRAVLGPFIGVFIDRYDRKRIMILADLFIAAASMIVVVFSGSGGLAPIPVIYLVMFLRALGSAFHDPTLQAVTPQIVPGDQLVRCSGYSQGVESVSMIASPALAGLLYNVWTLDQIIFLDVGGAVFAVIALLFSEIPRRENRVVTHASEVISEARDGWRLLRSNPGLLGLVFTSTLYSLAMMPISALFPLMAMDFFGGGSHYASVVEVVFAVGLLCGSVVLSITGGTKDRMKLVIFSFLIMSGSLFLSGALGPNQFVTFNVAAFVMGFSGPFFWGMFRVLLQEGFPSEYLGRVMALTSSITVIASPVGMIISGLFTQAVGAQKWFTIAGAMTLAAAGICVGVPSIRQCGMAKKETMDHDIFL